MTTAKTIRALCPHCEATPAGCSTIEILGGRRCCEQCDGIHSAPPRDVP